MSSRTRFRAALPHELDGVKLTKADLPIYVERCDELKAENARLLAETQSSGPITEVDFVRGYATAAADAIDFLRGHDFPYTQRLDALVDVLADRLEGHKLDAEIGQT